jgi:hypothetical protein
MDNREKVELAQVPFGQYEYINVSFAAADTDTLVPVSLKVEHPSQLRWVDITPNAGAFVKIYIASAATLVDGNLKLRCNVANYATRLLIFTERAEAGTATDATLTPPSTTATSVPTVAEVSDAVYGAGWNGDTTMAPSKNAVYDKMEAVVAGGLSIASQAAGDLITATSGSQLGRLAAVAAGRVLASNGTSTVPTWALVPLVDGVQFPATQVSSADANTLDDYEEGSWTPVIGGDGGTSGQAYSVQVGRYVKIGKMVIAQFRVQLSTLGTVTGAVQIQGLPFTSENTTNLSATGAVGRWYNLTTAFDMIQMAINPNTTAIYLWGATAAATALGTLATGDLNNATHFEGTVCYRATS